MSDILLYVAFPYAACILAIVLSVMRYWGRGFSVSSLSSQFLENRILFYGSVPWHYGIIGVLTGHLIGFFFPEDVMAFNRVPVRLYLMEVTGFMLAILAFVGLFNLTLRRLCNDRIRVVTSFMDIVLLVLLLWQVGLGCYIAVFHRWGSSWYTLTAVPYLRSLLMLQPDVSHVAVLPLAVKLHVLSAFTLIAIFPFTRLIHVLVMPLHFLWRPHQKVVWNWDRRRTIKQPIGQ